MNEEGSELNVFDMAIKKEVFIENLYDSILEYLCLNMNQKELIKEGLSNIFERISNHERVSVAHIFLALFTIKHDSFSEEILTEIIIYLYGSPYIPRKKL